MGPFTILIMRSNYKAISKFTVACQWNVPNCKNHEQFHGNGSRLISKTICKLHNNISLPKMVYVNEVSTYNSQANDHLPQLLFSCISWEVQCENCGIRAMRVWGGTGVRWSLTTLPFYLQPLPPTEALRPPYNDKWITDQQTKTVSTQSLKGWKHSVLKQAEGDSLNSLLIRGDVSKKWVA